MNTFEIELPSNRKFGFFLSSVFLVLGGYLYTEDYSYVSYIVISLGLLLVSVTLLKSEFLLPLNKLWMGFGLLLGRIVNPIVLALIFFGIFTPIGVLMRVFRRDELRLKLGQEGSHWIPRESPNVPPDAFKRQF